MPTDKNVDSEMAKCTSQRPSLTINAFSNWTAFFVRGGIAFFLIPAIFAHLGDKRFGMWTLVSSFVGYFGLLRLGVGTGVFRYVPLFRGKNDKSKVSEVISTGMAFYMGVGVLILAVSWVFADSIANFFEGGEELSALIRIIGFAAALECPVLILDAAIRGYEGFYLVNLISILGTVIRAGALFGCIRMDYGLVQMGWVVVIVTLLTLIAQVIAFKIFCKGIESGVRKINVAVLKLLVLYGLIIMVETSATILTFELP